MGKEVGGQVEEESPIRANNCPICGYRLLATHTPNIPFEESHMSVHRVKWADGGR